MKLSSYQESVNKNTINAQLSPMQNVNTPVLPAAYGADTSGLQSLNKAIGAGMELAEDNMTADVTKSLTEYQKRMDDLMYNPDSGLAYLKNENARNVTQQYIDGEKKIREEVFKTVPRYRQAQEIFLNKANAMAEQGVEQSNRQMYKESLNYSIAVMNDEAETLQIQAAHNYTQKGFLSTHMKDFTQKLAANLGSRMGAQWVKDKSEEMAGLTLQGMLGQASADDDQESIDNLINENSYRVNPAYIRSFVAKNNAYKKENTMLSQAKVLAAKYRNDPEGLEKYLNGYEIEEPSTGNYGNMLVSTLTQGYVGAPSQMADGSGTTCVYYPFAAAHKINPDVPVVTNTTQALDYAESKGIKRGADYLSSIKPGDMVVINDPKQTNDRDHMFVWTGNGIYNAGGASGQAYVKDFPDIQSAVAYFGNGVSVAGVIAMSELTGNGIGPGRKRKASPAEISQMRSAINREISILDGIDNKAKHDALESFKEEQAELIASGNYDTNAYMSLARRYVGQGGLKLSDLIGSVSSGASAGASIAGLTGPGAKARKGGMTVEQMDTQIYEMIKDGSVNQAQMRNALLSMGISDENPQTKSLYERYFDFNNAIVTNGLNVESLKGQWESQGLGDKDIFLKCMHSVVRLAAERKAQGKTLTRKEAWDELMTGLETYQFELSGHRYAIPRYRMAGENGIYYWDQENGVAYSEGINEPWKLTPETVVNEYGATQIE